MTQLVVFPPTPRWLCCVQGGCAEPGTVTLGPAVVHPGCVNVRFQCLRCGAQGEASERQP